MYKKNVWVVGHKNPDTDSICSAIAYANLKNKLAERNDEQEVLYVPSRAGEINAETTYVLSRFKVNVPVYISDVGTQIRDISFRRIEGVSSQISLKKAWELMKNMEVVTLPIVNKSNKLEGIIVTTDIAEAYMDAYDNTILSEAGTQYRNMVETLDGQLLAGNEEEYFIRGKVVLGTSLAEITYNSLQTDDLLIVGDNEEVQSAAIDVGCSCIIITNGLTMNQKMLEKAQKHQIVVICTPYDSFAVARLINQSIPVKSIMTRDSILSFELDDYVEEVREVTAKVRHRDFPILDEKQNYVGMFSRRNLLNAQKKQLILVDHNEKSQAVNNVDEAGIVEIVDHHRLGSLETISPVFFRNQPVGSTSTIIYQIYQERNVEITKEMAGLMCAAIVSDTLMFRSPTCTEIDVMAAKELARIAGVEIEELAYEMFVAGSDYDNKTDDEILNQDFKIFYFGDLSFGVSQINVMKMSKLNHIRSRVEKRLENLCRDKRVQMVFVMLTDIMTETTILLCHGTGAENIAKEAFWGAYQDGSIVLKGVVSRKKQLIPAIMNTLMERML